MVCLLILVVFSFSQPSGNPAFGLTVNYRYDDLSRLTRVERSDGWVTEYQYDVVGNRTSRTIKAIMIGDVNGDSAITLADAIMALQVAAGVTPGQPPSQNADISGDGRIGLSEAIYIMQKAAGLR